MWPSVYAKHKYKMLRATMKMVRGMRVFSLKSYSPPSSPTPHQSVRRVIDYNEWIKREADAWGREQRELRESRFLPMESTMNKFVIVSFNGSRCVQSVTDTRAGACGKPSVVVRSSYAGAFAVTDNAAVDRTAELLKAKLREKYDQTIEELVNE